MTRRWYRGDTLNEFCEQDVPWHKKRVGLYGMSYTISRAFIEETHITAVDMLMSGFTSYKHH